MNANLLSLPSIGYSILSKGTEYDKNSTSKEKNISVYQGRMLIVTKKERKEKTMSISQVEMRFCWEFPTDYEVKHVYLMVCVQIDN